MARIENVLFSSILNGYTHHFCAATATLGKAEGRKRRYHGFVSGLPGCVRGTSPFDELLGTIPRKTAIHLHGLGNQGRQGTRQNVMLGVPTPTPQSEEKWGNSLGK